MSSLLKQLEPETLQEVAARLEDRPAEEILAWALRTYKDSIVLACSFGGPTGMVLLDMIMKMAPSTPVFYLDTEFLFPETHALIERVSQRYGFVPLAVRPELTADQQAQQEGDRLWERNPDRCCELRKVAPQRQALAGFGAWITGLRRDQASTRRSTPVVSWDQKFGLAKVAPLANWTEQQTWNYIVEHDVPTNALHNVGYPSIGCTHCTRPVETGEDARAGRWSGTAKTECGLHLAPRRDATQSPESAGNHA
ncbi:MAG: phosphoadenosine phosphosulfate reductase [Chloroflexi bacterium]|nr:phosphoadenosine phosphosulfate reductase [Chloroflexota bacterium]